MAGVVMLLPLAAILVAPIVALPNRPWQRFPPLADRTLVSRDWATLDRGARNPGSAMDRHHVLVGFL